MPHSPAAPSADRNLLLGILALQMNFVTRDALIEAMHAWVLEKTRSLAQILLDQERLTRSQFDLLEALVQEHLKVHHDDPRESLAALHTPEDVRRVLGGVAGLAIAYLLIFWIQNRRHAPNLPARQPAVAQASNNAVAAKPSAMTS